MLRRPAFFTSVAFSAGIILQNTFNFELYILLIPTVIFLSLYFVYKKAMALFIFVLFLGALNLNFYNYLNKPEVIPEGDYPLEGVIKEKIEYRDYYKYILSTDLENYKDVNLLIYSPKRLDYGDLIEVNGGINHFSGVRIPYGFDKRKYYERKGISAYIKNPEITLLDKGKGNWFYQSIIYPLKDRIKTYLRKNFEKDHAYILSGLVIGERESISSEIIEDFQKTGIIHILAISGLHVGFIYLILLVISQVLRIRYNYNYIFIIAGLVFFAILTGLKISVIRAVIFALLLIGARVFQRRSDNLNTLGAAAFIILLFKPVDLFSVSFLLSFTAVFGIIIFSKLFKIKKLLKRDQSKLKSFLSKYVYLPVFISLSVTIVLAPILAYYFYQVSLLGILLNIIVIPLTGCILALGVFVIFVNLVIGITISAFNISLAFLINILLEIAQLSSKLDFAIINIPKPNYFYLLITIAVLIYVIYSLFIHKYRKIILAILIFFNLCIFYSLLRSIDAMLEMIFFDIGQGDSALITTPYDTNILIDAGSNYNPNNFDYFNYFKAKGITSIEWLILSHRHYDHIGNVPELFEKVKIKNILTLPLSSHYRISHKIDSTARANNIPLRTPTAGDIVNIDNCLKLYILHPDTSKLSEFTNENNRSIVMKFLYRNLSILFTGDIERDVEENLTIYQNYLKSSILKFPHHGSLTSANIEFINMVAPDITVVSVGTGNKYNLPSDSAINIIKNTSSQIYRTDLCGSVILKYKDGNIQTETMVKK